MKWFYNLKLSVKLLVGFLVVTIFVGIVGYVGISNMSKIDSLLRDMNDNSINTITIISSADMQALLFNQAVYRHILETDNSALETIKNEMDSTESKLKHLIETYRKSNLLKTEEDNLAKFDQAWLEYKKITEKIIALDNEKKDQEAVSLMNSEGVQGFRQVDNALRDLVDFNRDEAKNFYYNSGRIYNNSRAVLMIIILVCVGAGIGLALFIARIISRPIGELVKIADKMALGDVNVTVVADTKDEIGALTESFERMIENIRVQALAAEKIAAGDLTVVVNVKSENDLLGLKLKEMVDKNNEVLSSINNASEQVAAGARQVSISSQALSQGSTEQAGSLEEITSSITEVATQTKQNAVNANQANELAIAAKESAIQGNQKMKIMLKAMEGINESSVNISKIIKVIDEIAFQTNILALNAAVEAARAGQHGKGFAVVAEEVRNLAARSADAAKETTVLIEGSVKKVEAGTQIAGETAEALNKIVESVSGATNLVAEIAAASGQQATAISQINQGIEQISQVTQTNTATAEESAAASEELSSQAEVLKNMMSRYKIRNHKTFDQFKDLSPDMLKALGNFVAKSVTPENHHELSEILTKPTQSKIKINLDDSEFGKY